MSKCGRKTNEDGGVYIAVFYLSADRTLRIGRLGEYRFQKGVYVYTGSAQRNLLARIERHGRKAKPLRWHIDYLSVHAEMLGVIVVPGPKARECRLARRLHERFERVAFGFGASDCQCGGHLFYAEVL